MITKINIGTDTKNFTGIKVNKPFKEITGKDIMDILNSLLSLYAPLGDRDFRIQGWADVTFPSVPGYYLVQTIESKWGVCYWDGNKFWDDPRQDGILSFGVKNEFLNEWFALPKISETTYLIN